MDLYAGDTVVMKKPHPCGSYEWLILRSGADFKIKCLKCSHVVMLDRINFEKRVKKIKTAAEEPVRE